MNAPSRQATENAQYTFWSAYTALQAEHCRFNQKQVGRRVIQYFREVCRAVDPTLGLELGAHEGRFSAWLKATFPAARCLALEANPYVFDVHRERLTGLGVEYRNLAAGPSTGTLDLIIPTELGRKRKPGRRGPMASLNVHTRTKSQEVVSVDAVRVDDLVHPEDSHRIVAWIDVEGAAGQVLQGSREVLSRASAVYIEVENSTTWEGQWLDTDVAAFFADLDMVPVIRDLQRPHQYNVVFVEQRLAANPAVINGAAQVLMPPRQRVQ
jgi:FkbM family methyltransferase